MTKKEFSILAAAIRTYYPKEPILPNEQALELWYQELCDIPANVAEAALRKWVSTNKWSPSIADLRELAATVVYGETPDWGEAWEEVLTSVRRYGLYNERKALESLSHLARQAAERTGFRNICLSEQPATERANFRMIYESLARREQSEQQLALPLQDMIQQIRQIKKKDLFLVDGTASQN